MADAQWSRFDDAHFTHYADLPLAAAWLARAVALTEPAVRDALSPMVFVEALGATRAAWEAVGNALRALNLRSSDVLSYRAGMTKAYGPTWRPDGTAVVTNPASPIGDVVRPALATYVAVRGGGGATAPAGTWVAVRMSLDDDGRVRERCILPVTCADPSGASRTLTDLRDATTGAACVAASTWRCAALTPPDVAPPGIAPPLAASFDVARDIALDLQRRGPSGAIRDAWSADPSGPGIARGVPPDYDVSAPPGFVRPAPSPPVPLPPTPVPVPTPVPFPVPVPVPSPPACVVPPPGTLQSAADVAAWNQAHPGCPPVALPAVFAAPPPARPGMPTVAVVALALLGGYLIARAAAPAAATSSRRRRR